MNINEEFAMVFLGMIPYGSRPEERLQILKAAAKISELEVKSATTELKSNSIQNLIQTHISSARAQHSDITYNI